MKFLEKDLEDIIFETDNDILFDRGLYIYGKKKRQLKIGNYGIADIVTMCRDVFFSEIKIQIIELKQNEININSLLQAIRYYKGIERYIFEKYNNIYDCLKIEIILIGNSIDKNEICYIPDIFDNVSIYTYEYNYDGITFNPELGYKLTDEGF